MSSDEFELKVVTAIADRANVNFRQYFWVLSQLKEDGPLMLKIHCINHRVELNVKISFLNPLLDHVDKFYKILSVQNAGKPI